MGAQPMHSFGILYGRGLHGGEESNRLYENGYYDCTCLIFGAEIYLSSYQAKPLLPRECVLSLCTLDPFIYRFKGLGSGLAVYDLTFFLPLFLQLGHFGGWVPFEALFQHFSLCLKNTVIRLYLGCEVVENYRRSHLIFVSSFCSFN